MAKLVIEVARRAARSRGEAFADDGGDGCRARWPSTRVAGRRVDYRPGRSKRSPRRRRHRCWPQASDDSGRAPGRRSCRPSSLAVSATPRVGRCDGAASHLGRERVSIERSLYRQSGQRGGHPGGRVVDPVSLRAGVVEQGWLPRTAQVMAHQVQQGPSRRRRWRRPGSTARLPYSRSSVERVAHLVGALAVADPRRTARTC